jgi:hypothetical protein
MNPNVKADLPKGMKTRATVRAMNVDFEKAAAMWEEVQDFLRKEFARQ